MLFLRKFFAGIFFLLATTLFLPFFITFVLLQTYFSQSFLSGTFIGDSYSKVDIILQEIPIPAGQDRGSTIRITKKIFSKNRYILFGRSFLDAFFEGLQSFEPGKPLKISLEKTKKDALSEVKAFSDELAVCTPQENFEIGICVPSSYSPSDQKLYRQEFAKQGSQILDANLPSNLSFQENSAFPWIQYLSFLLHYRIYAIAGMATLLFVLLVLMDLILFRPVALFFRWDAYFFLLSGLTCFGFFYLFLRIPELINKVESISPNILNLIHWFLSYPQKWNLIGGIVFTVLAAFSFILSFSFRPKVKSL